MRTRLAGADGASGSIVGYGPGIDTFSGPASADDGRTSPAADCRYANSDLAHAVTGSTAAGADWPDRIPASSTAWSLVSSVSAIIVAVKPTLAEVNDVYNTVADGAAGLVLAGETAIGAYPVECAEMVMRIARNMRDDPR